MAGKKAFLLIIVILTLVNCGKTSTSTVATVKGGQSPDTGSFDQFLYNEKPKAGQPYRYSASPENQDLDLGTVNNDNKHSLAGFFLLSLLRKGEYHLFYYKFMYFKNSDGTFCRAKDTGQINFRRVNKTEFHGKWSRTKKTITLENLGTLSKSNSGGIVQATLQMEAASVPTELSQKSTTLVPTTDPKDLTAWQAEQAQPSVKIADAVSQLDTDCAQ